MTKVNDKSMGSGSASRYLSEDQLSVELGCLITERPLSLPPNLNAIVARRQITTVSLHLAVVPRPKQISCTFSCANSYKNERPLISLWVDAVLSSDLQTPLTDRDEWRRSRRMLYATELY